MRRVVAARAAEPREGAGHGERARVVGGETQHGGREARRNREAAVEVEVLHALDAAADRLEEERAGAAEAGQGMVVHAVLEEPVLGDVDARLRVAAACGCERKAPR